MATRTTLTALLFAIAGFLAVAQAAQAQAVDWVGWWKGGNSDGSGNAWSVKFTADGKMLVGGAECQYVYAAPTLTQTCSADTKIDYTVKPVDATTILLEHPSTTLKLTRDTRSEAEILASLAPSAEARRALAIIFWYGIVWSLAGGAVVGLIGGLLLRRGIVKSLVTGMIGAGLGYGLVQAAIRVLAAGSGWDFWSPLGLTASGALPVLGGLIALWLTGRLFGRKEM